MEWREQSSVSSEEAYLEAQRWIEAVTKKKFGSSDFRSALENGVLLCELINKIKPGAVKRVNRLPTPIAGLDNLNVFLKACGKLGLKEAQLFHPGDLQDLSSRVTVKHQETSRRLKNVLITIYWLGRRAQCDCFYNGPYLNFKAFEGLLGTALYKSLQESSSQKGSNVRDSGFGDSWYSEREELSHLRGGGGGHRRDDSLDSLDSLGSRPHSISSDATLKGSSEGCCSDTEADSVFKMTENKDNVSYRRSVVITPRTTAQFNQFLPTKDKSSGYMPAPIRKKRAERNEDSRRSWASSSFAEDESALTSPHVQPHTPPQLPKSPLLETPPQAFAPVDPTSGPRLVKGKKWTLLGRQDPREPPDPIDYESIDPDLENDDMFARRTLAFQSNTNLAKMKTRPTGRHRRCTSEPQLNIVTQKPIHGGSGETEFPDIEQDDVVYRREKTQQAQQQRPLSGAPDNYSPMPIPEPWALPPGLKARLLCPPCPLTHNTATANQNEVDKEARPETDDMLIRKLRICSDQSQSSGSSASQKTPSVPSSCNKEDLQRWQAIREASQLRYKKRLMVERLAALKL